MTQIDARNAVNSIKLKLIQLFYDIDSRYEDDVQVILEETTALERSLSIRHFMPSPNCRKATPEELRQLCASSNVVVFPAA